MSRYKLALSTGICQYPFDVSSLEKYFTFLFLQRFFQQFGACNVLLKWLCLDLFGSRHSLSFPFGFSTIKSRNQTEN